MTLDGKTPSKVSGIKVDVDNNWMTLIQNVKINLFEMIMLFLE
ncbi:MAG TPA: hypothetical protein VFG24_07185 [Nitrosopumilaceae archaeon]|nr:hypothetical protein [Nitrosopumilaceae archaeon]